MRNMQIFNVSMHGLRDEWGRLLTPIYGDVLASYIQKGSWWRVQKTPQNEDKRIEKEDAGGFMKVLELE